MCKSVSNDVLGIYFGQYNANDTEKLGQCYTHIDKK